MDRHAMDEPQRHRPSINRISSGTSITMRVILPGVISAVVLLLLLSHYHDARYRARQGAALNKSYEGLMTQ